MSFDQSVLVVLFYFRCKPSNIRIRFDQSVLVDLFYFRCKPSNIRIRFDQSVLVDLFYFRCKPSISEADFQYNIRIRFDQSLFVHLFIFSLSLSLLPPPPRSSQYSTTYLYFDRLNIIFSTGMLALDS